MRQLTLAALALLAACTAPAPERLYRNPAQTLSSAALFDPARFGGDWQVVAAYGAEAECGALRESWTVREAGGFDIRGTRCTPLGLRSFAAVGQLAGPGRIERAGRSGPEALWVLWVDTDYRVAVLGTPSGAFGRILSRQKSLSADLVTAARGVLEFNGYDISQLVWLK